MLLFDILTLVGAGIGTIFLFDTFNASGAPQEAAGAAIAVAFAVIPYVVSGTLHRRRRRGED